MKDVDFTNFPPPNTHIKGIQIVTYEGLLQGITTHIMLYQISMTKTVNNRAIYTLGIESFFASLSKVDMMMTGCPKAVQIDRILPIMMQYNSYKHDPDKIFQMDSRKGTPYQYHEMEHAFSSSSSSSSSSSCDSSTFVQFKPHNFDKFCKHDKKRVKCNLSIGEIFNSECGKGTIHTSYCKIDTRKISVVA